MGPSDASVLPTHPPAGAADAGLHRSGAVARMLGMPVATLRVWERRYRLSQPALSPSGRRLYSADDVRRLALIKQLTDRGHAIGTLASLDMARLQQVAATHAQASDASRPLEQTPARAWRLAVVGAALAARLQRQETFSRPGGRPVQLLGPFDHAAQAAAALQASDVDAVLIHAPHLQPDGLVFFDAAAPALSAVPKAVLYGFAAEAVCEALAARGVALLRDPQPDLVLAQWLHHLAQAAAAPVSLATVPTAESAPPRRWDDAALAAFASRTSAVACECPRHVADLLVQLAHFESYSADCLNRNAPDAQLHAYLRQLAARSRTAFETALEHVALHEGLKLP